MCGSRMIVRSGSIFGMVSSMMARPVTQTQRIPREGWFAASPRTELRLRNMPQPPDQPGVIDRG